MKIGTSAQIAHDLLILARGLFNKIAGGFIRKAKQLSSLLQLGLLSQFQPGKNPQVVRQYAEAHVNFTILKAFLPAKAMA